MHLNLWVLGCVSRAILVPRTPVPSGSACIKFVFFLIIRRYVPEVRHLPVQYMFEPWKAPLQVQMAARCVVGYDYPEPMCDHRVQRRICVEKLKVISRDLNTRSKWYGIQL